MANPISLNCSCECGQVRATLTTRPDRTTRCVCFCRDCRAFAHALDRAADVLDARGGTEVVQMVSGALHLDQGSEHLRLMQLAEGGLFRWHTNCCRSPIGNTARTTRLPFIGVIDSFLTEDSRVELQKRLPLHAHVHARSAREAEVGEARRDRGSEQPLGGTGMVIRRFGGIILSALLRRDARRAPLFEDGTPICEPTVLSPDERSRLAEMG